MPGSDELNHEESVVEDVVQTENDLDMSEDDYENEDEELVVGDAFAEDEMADVDADHVASEKDGRARHPYVYDTDDESEDEEDVRNLRRGNRDVVRDQMKEKNSGIVDAWSSPDVWDCECVKCEHIMSQFVVRPRIEGSTRWNRMKMEAPADLVEMVMKGKLPTTGKKWKKIWKDIATTPILYASGLRQFLGKLQQVLQQSPVHRSKLDNGRLHLFQLMEYNKWNFIPFPELPMKQVEKITSSNMQKFAWCGYRQLVESTILWLAEYFGGIERFHIETTRVEGEGEESYQQRVTDNYYKSEDRRMRESNLLQRILDNMQRNKPWARMDGTAVWHKEQMVGVVLVVVVLRFIMVCYYRTSLILSLVVRLRWIVPVSPDISTIH